MYGRPVGAVANPRRGDEDAFAPRYSGSIIMLRTLAGAMRTCRAFQREKGLTVLRTLAGAMRTCEERVRGPAGPVANPRRGDEDLILGGVDTGGMSCEPSQGR